MASLVTILTPELHEIDILLVKPITLPDYKLQIAFLFYIFF